MSKAIEKVQEPTESMAAKLERVLIKGDLAKLTDEEAVYYYKAVCESVGLNPLTKPFEFLVLKGKTVLYCLKGGTDQLRTIHNISIHKLETRINDGMYEVTAYARNGDGREDADLGAVSLGSLRGEDLANAKLKAVTKAKRRVTLSICGLGMLDESEVESMGLSPERREEEALKNYLPASTPPPAPPTVSGPPKLHPAPPKPKPPTRPAKYVGLDNVAALGELIRELRARGIPIDDIQARMKKVTGCTKRAELNGGQAVAALEEFEEWITELDSVQAAEIFGEEY